MTDPKSSPPPDPVPYSPEQSIELNWERPRRHYDPGIHGSLRWSTQARIADLGLGGVGVFTRRPLPLRHRFSMDLPYPEPAHEQERLHLEAVSIWTHFAGIESAQNADDDAPKPAAPANDPVFRTGMRFVPGTVRTSAVQQFLDLRASEPTGHRVPPRFELGAPFTVELHSECPFIVRTISVTGGLLDIDPVADPGVQVDLCLQLQTGELPLSAEVVDVLRRREREDVRSQMTVRFLDRQEESLRRLASYLAELAPPGTESE